VNSVRKLLLLAILALIAPLAQSHPTQAQEAEYGYLWALEFPFEQDFTGILTIEVGPWKNGELVSVDETSTAKVTCRRVGAVYLNGGDAVFDGGYLECGMDLGAIVAQNHGLTIEEIDSYASMLFAASLETTVANVAPIFTHDDAAYTIDFTQPGAVTLSQQLENQLGPQQATFVNSLGFVRQKYSMVYGCIWLGPCNSFFTAGTQGESSPPGGDRMSFATGPASFRIGGDGVTTFHGRIGHLIIDPGNTVH
jgi:hypothetical protein